MIVVGILGAPGPDGASALEIAGRAAAAGARVEMVGVAPATPGGDARLLELAAAGIGHATVIRSGAHGIEPADLDLAMRYLPDVRAIVLVRPEATLLPVASAAAGWSGAGLIVVGPLDADLPNVQVPARSGAIVLDPPAADPDGTFAGFVAELANRFEAGEHPDEAWRSTLTNLAVDKVSGTS